MTVVAVTNAGYHDDQFDQGLEDRWGPERALDYRLAHARELRCEAPATGMALDGRDSAGLAGRSHPRPATTFEQPPRLDLIEQRERLARREAAKRKWFS